MRFTESHEWVSVHGKQGKIGVTDYAQKELGEIVYVSLPKVGQKIKAGEEACVLESTKAAADVYAPISGVVVAVNEEVREKPSLINTEPETTGWLFQIEVANSHELDALLSKSDYQTLIS